MKTHAPSKVLFTLLLAVGMGSMHFAQTKIEGVYNSKTKKFDPVDRIYNIGDFRNGSYSDGRMIVSINFPEGRKKRFVDEKGIEVIPCIYHDVKAFSGGKAQVQKDANGPWITIDVNEKEVNPGWKIKVS